MNPTTYQISPQIQQQIDLMNQLQHQQQQPQVDPNQQKIQYLYNLAQMNPRNSAMADQYLNAYMAYKYPQPDPMQELFQQMGYQVGPGLQQAAGQQYGTTTGQGNFFASPNSGSIQTQQGTLSPQGQPQYSQPLVINVPDQPQQQQQGQGQPQPQAQSSSQAQPDMSKVIGQGINPLNWGIPGAVNQGYQAIKALSDNGWDLNKGMNAYSDLVKNNYMSPDNVGGQQINPSLQNSYNSSNGYANQFSQFNNPPRS